MLKKTILTVVGLMLTAPNSRPQGSKPPEQIGQLLEETKSTASLIQSDIATLDFFMTDDGLRTNAALLEIYEGKIHELRDQTARLEKARKSASTSQQLAIDRIIPVLQEFLSSAEAAIAAGKNGLNLLNRPEFHEYLKLNADLTAELSNVIAAWADYAGTKEALDRTRQKLPATLFP